MNAERSREELKNEGKASTALTQLSELFSILVFVAVRHPHEQGAMEKRKFVFV